jgi:hypothetical protein
MPETNPSVDRCSPTAVLLSRVQMRHSETDVFAARACLTWQAQEMPDWRPFFEQLFLD